MDVTKPYEFIGFGAMNVTKPYKFIGFGAMAVTWSPMHFSRTVVIRLHSWAPTGGAGAVSDGSDGYHGQPVASRSADRSAELKGSRKLVTY